MKVLCHIISKKDSKIYANHFYHINLVEPFLKEEASAKNIQFYNWNC